MQAVTIIDICRKHAEERASESAFIHLNSSLQETEVVSFGELDRAARWDAAKLLRVCKAGDRAMIVACTQSVFIRSLLACLYSGVIAVPCDATLLRRQSRAHQLTSILRGAQAQVILTDVKGQDDVARWLSDEQLADRVKCLSVEGNAEGSPYRSDTEIRSSQIALLQYTSGSTSEPKGVAISHENILENQKLLRTHFGHGAATGGVSWLPLHHDMGLIGNVLQPLYLGICSVLMEPMTFVAKPINWITAISRYRASTSGGPTFAYQLCADRLSPEQLDGVDLRSWQTAYVGAEPIRRSALESFAEMLEPFGFSRRAFFPCYGLAESTLFVCGSGKGRTLATVCVDREALALGEIKSVETRADSERDELQTKSCEFVSVGCCDENHHVAIVDPAASTICPAGRVGELWVSHSSVGVGYWEAGELHDDAFRSRVVDNDRQTYLRTGDLGFKHGNQIFIAGRIRDLIIVRGRNLFPHDIEATAQAASGMLAKDGGVAFAVSQWAGEAVVLVHEVKRAFRASEELSATIDDIRAAVVEAHGIVPMDIVLVAPFSLARTSSSKLRRRNVRQAYLDHSLKIQLSWLQVRGRPGSVEVDVVENSGDSEAIEVAILEAIRELLRVEINVETDFGALGVDSLCAMQAIARVRDKFGVEIRVQEFYSFSNVRKLARQVSLRRKFRALTEDSSIASGWSFDL